MDAQERVRDDGAVRSARKRERTTLASLEVLVATDSHGSISAASRALGITQPTASAALRRLERTVDLPLVVRAARGSILTETGRATAAWAREVLDASDRFETAIEALRRAPSTVRVRVAASMTIAEHLAPRWLAARPLGPDDGRGRTAPDVELVVRNSREVMELVLEEDVHVGFVESPTVRRGLRSRTFARDELVVVVGADHPWRRRTTVDLDTLLGSRLVLREPGSGTRETFETALAAAGAALPAHLPYLGSTAAVLTAVLHGQAVAVVSALAVADGVARGTVHTLTVPGLDLSRTLRAVWKDGVDPAPEARAIVAQAMRSARQTSQV